MRKTICIVLVGLAVVSRPAAAEARRVTLEEALGLADLSPGARAVSLEIDRARAEVRAAGLWPNPEILVSREESAGTVERFASLTVPLVLSGRLGLERNAARQRLAAAQARARQQRVSLRAEVRGAFYDLLAAQERVAALESAASQLIELVAALRAREIEGESSGFDRMRGEREQAEVRAEFLASRGRRTRSQAFLAALLAIPSDGLAADGSLLPTAPLLGRDELLLSARLRGDVVSLDSDLEGAEMLARAAGRRLIPEPFLTAGSKTTAGAEAHGTGAELGISFAVPLFDRGQGLRAIAEAEGRLLRTGRELRARLAEAEAEAAYAEAVARREAEESYATAGAPEELVSIARAAYQEGEMKILELLDAYRTALAFRLRMIELRVEARRAEAALALATGLPDL